MWDADLFVPSIIYDKKISLWRKDGNSLAVPVAVKNDGDSEVNFFLDYFLHVSRLIPKMFSLQTDEKIPRVSGLNKKWPAKDKTESIV